VLATNKTLVVEDLHDKGARARRHGVRSAMAVPIADDDGVLGVLNGGSRMFQARFSASHQMALEALGRIGAVALRNARAIEASRTLYFDTLRALSLALETKDPYSRGATDRVLELATALGVQMGLEEREQSALRVAALLHDVGMAALGDAAIVENRPLTTVEWGMIQMHPVIASDVLTQAPALADAVPIVYHHHEHYDGRGYVLGISGERIPLGARVLAVADAFVALTSERPYRPAMAQSQALEEIASKSGTQFDPEVVQALERHLGELKQPQART
jgi:HD-GYP domain-containing protein (c-di-GMP phosphodiesterase class II)